MITTRTPFRLSFFGGGTDYQPFFEEHGGAVLSATFDKYVYSTVRHCPPFFDYHTSVHYSKSEFVRKTEEISHPLVRNSMIFTNAHNLSVVYDADLPARSGLGSSSAFAVGLLHALYAMQGKYVNKQRLAEDAIHVERVLCNESGGWQDQVAAAFGGLNRIDFNASGFSVTPLALTKPRKKQLENRIMMFFTGISRISAKVAKVQTEVTKEKAAELIEMKKLVFEAEKILLSETNISEFGRLLDYTWRLKRGLTREISNDYIDEIYARAGKAGAIGGKLLGAGGGGFIIFFAEPEYHEYIKAELKELVYVPIQFENDGTKILYHAYEDYDFKENKQ